jgi:hypothetical protein
MLWHDGLSMVAAVRKSFHFETAYRKATILVGTEDRSRRDV